MQRAALGAGNDVGRGARDLGAFELRPLRCPQRRRRQLYRAPCRRIRPGVKPTTQDADPSAAGQRERCTDRFDGALRAGGILAIRSLHRVIGERQPRDAVGERSHMIEAVHERIGAAAR